LGITGSQLALSWILSKWPTAIPIPGTKNKQHLLENIKAADIKLEKEIPDILKFVETIQTVVASAPAREPSLRNVMRADENPHEGGIYTEALLKASPAHAGGRITVKQVISRRK